MSATSSTSDKSKALTQKDYQAKLVSTPDNKKYAITSKDVATLPKPGTISPTSIQFLGSKKMAYLLAPDATALSQELFVVDTETGERTQVMVGGDAVEEGKFSHEEQMRRERARLMATGVTSFQLSKPQSDGAIVGLIPHGGGLWIWDTTNTQPRLLVESSDKGLRDGTTLLDAKISSDGSTVAFVADDEVYVMSVDEEGGPTQVTSGARDVEGRTNGVSDYLAQEELSRPEGFWLSPDGQTLAFEQVDEAHIPAYRIVHQAAPGGLAPSLVSGMSTQDMVGATKVSHEEHRFCFAGTVNPKVKMGIQKTFPSDGDAEVMWLDLESIFGPDFYLAKTEWLKDNSAIVVQVLDRRQKNLALVMFDATTGARINLHLEQAMDEKSWVNLNDGFRVLEYSNNTDEEKIIRFLWASEQDGYRHLYVREANLAGPSSDEYLSKQVHRITGPGEFIVDSVVDVDADNKLVYYMGTTPGKWLGKRLYRAKLEGNGEETPECLTPEKGQHDCKVDSKAGIFVDAASTVDHPTIVTLRKLDTSAETLLDIHDAGQADPRVAQFDLQPPTFHTFPSTDQKVTLQAAFYAPDALVHGPGPYPLVVATYGGPHVQYVQNTWGMMTADLRTQFLRDQGFAVIKVDNRGSNRRGLVFETPVFGNMGELEVADQAAGVQYAIDQGWADPNRVAVSGWSYGGYMALKCLSERPDVFHAAISGAPVTDWTLYDTAYTERYMGLPQENVEGYQKASALHKVNAIEGSLMLCHGLMDENVLFRQTSVLINQLIEHQKAYDLVMFPSERHGPRRPQDRAFLEERIVAFLQRSLNL
uniref:Peptidase S9 prolyl oligopeptidase catalytic domain-containing protein n=1 Tax=Ditylum brightwellii TaxID=49249 RepID=A0A7S4VLW7_9STRA